MIKVALQINPKEPINSSEEINTRRVNFMLQFGHFWKFILRSWEFKILIGPEYENLKYSRFVNEYRVLKNKTFTELSWNG